MRLIRSSEPGAVERDGALSLVAESAIRTRAVCQELRESGQGYVSRRTMASLWCLLDWVRSSSAASVKVEPHAGDGIDQMLQPPRTEAVVAEIRAGANVCEAFFMLLTADTGYQADADKARLRSELDDYWTKHPSVANVPA
jgi:hypothetical protein